MKTLCPAPFALVLALTAGLCLPGCDDRGPVAQAIDEANIKLTTLSPNGGAIPSDEYRQKVYREVTATLQGKSGGTAAQQSAAAVLLSRAQLGLAEVPAAEAADIEQQLQHQQTQVRAALDQWRSLSAQAASLASYDPSTELNEIARQSQEREAAIQREQARKADVDARVADLRNQAASKASAAKAKRQEESAILGGMAQASAVEGEKLLRQGVDIRRQADALDVESSDLEARASQVAPQSEQVQLEIDRLTAQRALLDTSREEVSARAAAMKERAGVAQAEASQAATALAGLVTEMESVRATLPYEDAGSQFQTAAGTAKKAGSADNAARAAAELAHGTAQQALGDLRLSQAHGLARATATYDALASASPALPDAAKYKATLATLQESRKAALEAATEAYSAAAASFQNAGGSEQARQRLDSVIMGLSRTVKATSGGTKDLAVEMGLSETPTPAPEESGEAPPDGGSAQAGTPGASVEAVIGAIRSGQFQTILDYIHTTDPTMQGLLRSAAGVAQQASSLSDAMVAKFGKGLMDLGATGPAASLDLERLKSLTAADFPVEVTGDTAVVHSPPDLEGPNDGLLMRRVDGVWKVDLEAMQAAGGQGGGAQQLTMMAALVGPMIKDVGAVFDEVRAGVESGAYADLEAVQAVLEQKMQAVVQKVMGGMMGGMPPPGGG